MLVIWSFTTEHENILPAKRFIAKIANIRKMITMTNPTLAIAGTDVISASISVFMEEL